MKKASILLLVLMLILVGCQSDEVTKTEVNTSETETVDTKDTEEIEVEEVVEEEVKEPFVVNPESLRAKAAEHGIYIGAAVSMGDFGFDNYLNTLFNEYSMMTTENLMKWDRISAVKRGSYNFVAPDMILQHAKDHDMVMRGHAIVWHDSRPDWLKVAWTKEELTEVLEEYIEDVMGHFKGEIHSWDVLNEIISDENGAFRESRWYEIMGTDYIRVALIKAREVDPNAKLIINDYSIEEINPKSDALYELAKELIDEGVPLDGIGFQSHLVSGGIDFDSMQANIDRFQELGLEVQFTEIDIRVLAPFTEERMAVQKEDYKQLMKMALDNDIDTFVLWGVSDTQSWVPMWFQDYGSPLIFDNVYEKKGGYYGMMEALEEHEQ